METCWLKWECGEVSHCPWNNSRNKQRGAWKISLKASWFCCFIFFHTLCCSWLPFSRCCEWQVPSDSPAALSRTIKLWKNCKENNVIIPFYLIDHGSHMTAAASRPLFVLLATNIKEASWKSKRFCTAGKETTANTTPANQRVIPAQRKWLVLLGPPTPLHCSFSIHHEQKWGGDAATSPLWANPTRWDHLVLKEMEICQLLLLLPLHHIQSIRLLCLLSNIWLWDCSDTGWAEGAGAWGGEQGGGITFIFTAPLGQKLILRFNSHPCKLS